MIPPSPRELPRLAPPSPPEPFDRPHDERFDRVVRLAHEAFGVPMVAVNLLDPVRLHTIAAVGLPPGESARAGSFCEQTVEDAQTLVVPDASEDARFAHLPAVAGDPHIRFYAGQPLFGPGGGQPAGTLCLFDTRPRELTPPESRMLRDLAGWVERELAYDAHRAPTREVQRRLLPRREVLLPGYRIAGHCTPGRNVGGDYFDWQLLDSGVVQVVVADVTGKGMEAAVLAAGVRAALRGNSRFHPLDLSVGRTAVTMQADLADAGAFVTMFAARLYPESGLLEYVGAGHGLALVVDAAGLVRRLESTDLPLGAAQDDGWQAQYDHLDAGDTLLVMSDGVLDRFPDAETAIQASVAVTEDLDDADEMAARIAGPGAEPLDDDNTAVVIRRAAP